MKTVGMFLIECLEAYAIDTVFGIPGVHTVELYRGLANSSLRHVSARHEGALGFMADGYARASGRPAACFVITGPGLSNIATAMGQALADSIPMLVISSVNARAQLGMGLGCLHEMPSQRLLAASVSRFSHTLLDASTLPQVLARAFAVFESERPGPVHIEIPLDVMSMSAAEYGLLAAPAKPMPSRSAAAPECVEQAAKLLSQAQQPLMVVGGGALAAQTQVRQLAELLPMPVLMTIQARGLLPPEHPLGISYSPSYPAVQALLQSSDVVLAVGTELGPTDFDIYATGKPVIGGQLLRLDIDAQQAQRNYPPNVALVGDAKLTLQALLSRLNPPASTTQLQHNPAAKQVSHLNQATQAALDATTAQDIALLQTVRQTLPEALIVGDSTRMVYSGNLAFAANAARTWFNSSVGFGALGFGLPAAIGAYLATGKTVVGLVGDGGLQFSLAELGSAKQVGAKLIMLLYNNQGYGEIKAAMLASHVAPIGVDLYTPNFQTLAQSYGWQAHLLTDLDQLPTLLRQAQAGIDAQGPTLIEIRSHDYSNE